MKHQNEALQALTATLPGLQASLSVCRESKNEYENIYSGHENGIPDLAAGHFEGTLNKTFHTLTVALEVAGLSRKLEEVYRHWGDYQKHGIERLEDYAELDMFYHNPAFTYLSHVISSLEKLATRGESAYTEIEIGRLEGILRGAPNLLRRRSVVPTRELDIQEVMNDYLEVCFDEYRTGFTITGGLKHFVPDGGVPSIKAAIEFKFARTESDVAKCLSGIYEDNSGYKGSQDWTRFYSVVYMADAFELEARFLKDLVRGECFTWKPILVNGSSDVSPKKSRRRRAAKG